MLRFFIAAAVVKSLCSCAIKPTVTTENFQRKTVFAPTPEAFEIFPDSAVLDVREPFEYSTGHIPNAHSLQWSDFTESNPEQRGVLQSDLYAAARRLARMGIGPDTKVAVVGKGIGGHGEEGRVAWMLLYLGVKDVRFASESVYKGHRVTQDVVNLGSPQSGPSTLKGATKDAPVWKPSPLRSLNVTRSEVQFALNSGVQHKPVKFKNAEPVVYQIIDVRNSGDYLGQNGFGAGHHIPNMNAVNIPWQEFFTPQMKFRREMRSQLEAVGILPEHRVIVVDEGGVGSGAVTVALRALGFSNAGNYAGGLIDLLSAYH